MTRVLIVAPYASARAGLHALLADAPDLQVVGEVASPADMERVLAGAGAEVVLLQGEGEGDAARVAEALAGGDTGLVLLGGDTPGDYFVLAASSALPAWGYLAREADGPALVQAVRAVAGGLIVLDRGLLPLLAAAATVLPDDASSFPDDHTPGESLTARETEVLQLMAQGLPNKIIATRLGISLHTVKFHVASILAKLGATSRTEAVTLGVRRGHVLL